jgi:hypothetical protein
LAFAFIATVSGSLAGPGVTTVNASSALNVAAGDVLFAHAGWQDALSGDTIAVDENDGTDAFTLVASTKLVQASDTGGALFYLVAAGADASFTPRFTVSPSGRRLTIIGMQFRPDAGATIAEDGATVAGGTGTALNSGTITTTGTDVVVVGGGATPAGALSPGQIGGVNASGFTDAGGWGFMWYRILSATMTNGAATVTAGASDLWVCNILALSATVGASEPGAIVFNMQVS